MKIKSSIYLFLTCGKEKTKKRLIQIFGEERNKNIP